MARKFKLNVGWHDRLIRVLIGLAIIGGLWIWLAGERWLALVGVIPILTAIGGWDPIYEILDMTTDTTVTPEIASKVPPEK
ncbi:MAG: YgaP family membrane protein [Stellaceae bacterium]